MEKTDSEKSNVIKFINIRQVSILAALNEFHEKIWILEGKCSALKRSLWVLTIVLLPLEILSLVINVLKMIN